MTDSVLAAYTAYDSDPRVNGPDGYEAFRDAVLPLIVPSSLRVMQTGAAFIALDVLRECMENAMGIPAGPAPVRTEGSDG